MNAQTTCVGLVLFCLSTITETRAQESNAEPLERLLYSEEYSQQIKGPVERDYIRLCGFGLEPQEHSLTKMAALGQRVTGLEELITQLRKRPDLQELSDHYLRWQRNWACIALGSEAKPRLIAAAGKDSDILLLDAPIYIRTTLGRLLGNAPYPTYQTWVAASDRKHITDPVPLKLMTDHHFVDMAVADRRFAIAVSDYVAVGEVPEIKTGLPGKRGMELRAVEGPFRVLAVWPAGTGFEQIAVRRDTEPTVAPDLSIGPISNEARSPQNESPADAPYKLLAKIDDDAGRSIIISRLSKNELSLFDADGKRLASRAILEDAEVESFRVIACQIVAWDHIRLRFFHEDADGKCRTRFGDRSVEESIRLQLEDSIQAGVSANRLYVVYPDYASGGLKLATFDRGLQLQSRVQIPTEFSLVDDFTVAACDGELMIFTNELDEGEDQSHHFKSYRLANDTWSTDEDWWESGETGTPACGAVSVTDGIHLYAAIGRVGKFPLVRHKFYAVNKLE